MDWLRCALPPPNVEKANALERFFMRTQLREGLEVAWANPLYAGRELQKWFRKNRKLGSRDRKTIAEAVYGIIRHEKFLLQAGYSNPEEWIDGWRKILEGERFPDLSERNPAEDFSTALSLPVEIAKEWMEALPPDECAKLAQVINKRAPQYLRVNGRKANREQIKSGLEELNILTETCPETPMALKVLHPANIAGTPFYRKGEIEIQDLSSQRLCQSLPVEKDMIVLDLCAGAGGKSLALAAMGAKVYAHDTRSNALRELQKRARRANCTVILGLPEKADLVLVDAPCSGTGRLRREPALRWRYRQNDFISELLALQNKLLLKGADFTTNSGKLVYSTCSIWARENVHIPMGFREQESKWVWPQEDRGDGFYWKIMARK